MTRTEHYILKTRVDATSYQEAGSRILEWAQRRESRYVCAANVHMVMEGYDHPDFQQVVNQADLVTPDGMPLVWVIRRLGAPGQQRVSGPELTLAVCQEAERRGIPVALYGGTPEALEAFTGFLHVRFPTIRIACRISPPFRPLTVAEDAAYVRQLTDSGAGIVLVGLGCPKQEQWMAQHRGRIPAVLMGVGAAFDFFGGKVRRAPEWMQRLGLEWFFRLLQDPRRLWRRYLKHNPRFVAYSLGQVLRGDKR